MERCGFFDAELVGEEYDRTYLAEQFAAYFASFIGNGVFGGKSDELQIVAMENPSMQVAALSGQAWINGYWYENTDEFYLPVDVADGVLDRIDSVVLRLGFAERNMWLEVKRGTPSNNPLAPELVRNADYYELQLATVHIKAGALNIKQADITDARLDSTVCGFVVAVINEFDTSEFNAQLNSWIELFKSESIEEINALVEQLETIIDAGDIGPIITDINNKVDKAGDVMTGNLAIEKEIAALDLRTSNGAGRILKNANATSDLGTDILDETVNGVRDRINLSAGRTLADKLRLVVSGEKIYRILHTGNMELIKPADIGAVNKVGDTMTGNLGISKDAAPTFILTEQSTGASLHMQFWNNQFFIANRPTAGNDLNYRTILISNHAAEDDVVNAIGLSDVRDGVANFYTVIHTGNLSTFGIGVVPASVE